MNPYYQQPQHHLQAPQIYGQQQQSFQAVPSVAPPNFYQQQAWPPGFGAVPQYQVPYQLPQTPYQAVAQPIQSVPAPVASQQMKQGIAEPPPLPKSTPVPELPPRPPPPEENVKPPPPPDEQRSVSSVTSDLKSGTIASQVNNNATMTAMQLQSSLSFGNIKTKPLTGDEDLETLNTQLKQLEGQMKNYQSEYEKWHKEFTAWQKQHENHPDQKQYIQYQQKYQKMIEQQQRSLQQQYIELQKRIKVKQNQQMMTTQTGNNVSSKSQTFPNQQSQQNMYGGTAQNTPASFSSSNVYNKPSNMQDYAKNLQHQNSASVASSADTNLQSSQYSQGGSYSGNQNQFQNASDNYQHKIAQDNYTNFGSNLKECISQNQNKNNQYGDQQSANCLPQNQQTSNYSQSSQQTSYYNQPNQASSSQSSGMFASNKWSSNQQQSNQSSNHPATSNWSSSNPPSEKPSSDQWSSNQGSSQSSTRSSNYQSSENSSAGQWGTNTHASSQPASTSQWSSNYQSSAQPSSNSWGSNYQSSEQRSSTQWSSNSNSVEKPVWSSTQKPLGNQSSSLWSTNQQTSNKPTSYQNSSEFHPATNLQPPKEPPTSQMNANVPYKNQLEKSQIRQQTPQNQSMPSRVSVPGPRVPHTGSTTPRMPSRGPAPGPRAQQGGTAAGSRMPDAASTASPRMPARGPTPGPRAPQGGTATGPRMPGAATAASPRMPARGPAPGPRAPQGGAATGSRMPVGASIASPRMPARGPSPGPRAPQGGTATGPRMPGAATAASPRMPVRGQAPNPRIPQTGSMSSPRMPARVPAPGPRTPQGGTATGPRMPLLASAASPRMPLRGAAPAPRMPQGGSATSARIPARGPAPSPRIPQGGSIIGTRPSQAASASGPRMPLRGPSPAPRMPIKGSVPDSGNQAQEKQKDPASLPSLMSQNITNESKYKQIDKMSNERLLFSDSEDSSHNEAEKGLQKSSDLGNQVKGTADSHEQQIQPPQDGENFWDDDVSDFNIWDSKRGIPEKQFTENQENSQDQLSSQQKPVDQLEASHLDKTLSVSQANSLRPVLGSERKIMPVLSASSNSIRQQIVSTNSFSKPAENKPSSSASVYQTSSVTTHLSRTSVPGEPGVTKPEINSAPAVEPLAKTATAVSTAVSATVTSVTSSTTTAVTSVSMSDSKAIPSFQPAVSQSQPSFAPRQPGGPARPFGPNSGPTSSRPPFGPRGGVASGVRGPRSLHAGRGGSFNTAAPQPTVTENSNLSSSSQWTPIHKVSEIKHGTCRYFPDCRFGAACRFKHPDCPDFIYCQNRNCALEHYEPPKDTSENYQNNRKFIDEEQHQSFSSQRTEDDGYQNQRHSQSDDYYDNRVSSEYYDRNKDYYDSNERQGEYSQNENYYSNDQYYSQRYDDDYTQRRNDGPENNYDQYQDYPSDRYNTDRNTADENRPSGPGYSSDYEPERKRLHEESEGDQYGTSTAPRGEFFRERYEFDKRYRDWEKQHFPVDDPTREWEFEMRRRELLGQKEADKSHDYARSYDYDRDAEGCRKSYDGYERPYDDRYDDPAYRRDPLYGRPSEPIRPVVFDYGHEKKLGLYDVDLSKLNDDNNATLSERPISPSKQQPDRMLSPRRSPRRSRSPHRRSYSPRRSESRSRRSASPSRRRRSRRSPSPRRRSPSHDHRRRDRSRERHTSRDREHSRSRSTSARPRENEDRKSRSGAARSYGSRIETERGIMGYDDGRVQNIKEPGPETVVINDLLEKPGRDSRPKQIVIILRGPPGCGKTHIAKIIKDKEVSFGAHAPRILALDDYFITESDVYEKDEETGKRVKVKKMEYVYEEEMEAAYRVSLLKSFNKTLDNGYFPMVIIDAINDKVEHFQKFWSDGKHKGFEVFIAEMQGDASDCADKNIHNWSQTDIQKMLDNWEPTPNHFKRLDVRSLVQDATIKEVEMEEIEQPVEEEHKEEKEGEKEEDVDEEECGTFHVPMKSKWEESKEEQLAKLDGIRSNKEKKSIKNSILDDDEYDDDPYDEKEEDMRIGKKRVRWADIEERKMLEHRKRIGFCIGTDWSVLTDPNAQVPL